MTLLSHLDLISNMAQFNTFSINHMKALHFRRDQTLRFRNEKVDALPFKKEIRVVGYLSF